VFEYGVLVPEGMVVAGSRGPRFPFAGTQAYAFVSSALAVCLYVEHDYFLWSFFSLHVRVLPFGRASAFRPLTAALTGLPV